MKRYLILVMILVAGATAYPQATRTTRQTKNEKGSAKKETVQRSNSRSNAGRKATVKSSGSTRSQKSNAAVSRSRNTTTRQSATRSGGNTSRQTQRATVNTRSSNSDRNAQSQNRIRSTQARKSGTENNATRRQTTVTRPADKSRNGAVSARTMRENNRDDNGNVRINTSSATRTYREGRGTLTRNDGTVIHHQNDQVFTSRRYKLDYDNYNALRRSDDFRRDYRNYDNWYRHRRIRVINHYHTRYVAVPWDVRRVRFYARRPVHIDLVWTPLLFHRFMYYYPTHLDWNIDFGSNIETISAYDAMNYPGSVKRVYGKVDEVYYSPEDETYILYIGAPFPYQDMSVVIPKEIARQFSLSPKWYFENEYIWVVGLIDMWEGKPEVIVRDEDQIRKY
jgi:hypothetical protein